MQCRYLELLVIKMNTLEPMLTDNRENLEVHRALTSCASRRIPVRSSILVTQKKHWRFRHLIFLMPLGAVALIIYKLQAVPADVIRQEFEGFGAAICAAACGGILHWRVTRALALEQRLQIQPPVENQAPVSSSEPNLAEPRKVQSSSPSHAATALAASVASFPIGTRT